MWESRKGDLRWQSDRRPRTGFMTSTMWSFTSSGRLLLLNKRRYLGAVQTEKEYTFFACTYVYIHICLHTHLHIVYIHIYTHCLHTHLHTLLTCNKRKLIECHQSYPLMSFCLTLWSDICKRMMVLCGGLASVLRWWLLYLLVRDARSARMTHFGQEWVFSPHGKMSGEPLKQAFVILSTKFFENNIMFTLFS